MEQFVDIGALLPTMILIGFLTESVVELIKQIFEDQKWPTKHLYIISIVVSLVLCSALQVSLFDQTSPTAYFVGIMICALVASRGSNFVHNWLDTIPTRKK